MSSIINESIKLLQNQDIPFYNTISNCDMSHIVCLHMCRYCDHDWAIFVPVLNPVWSTLHTVPYTAHITVTHSDIARYTVTHRYCPRPPPAIAAIQCRHGDARYVVPT